MTIFKAYDIRGIYGVDLTTDIARKLGVAIAKLLNEKRFLVGMDLRTHSLDLAKALIDGLLGYADVDFVGNITTPIAHFASRKFDEPAIMITASHNPPEYNGMKIMRRGGADLESHEIQELRELLEEPRERRRGIVYVKEALAHYYDFIKERFDELNLSVGFDPANASGVILKGLLESVFNRVVSINDVPDGTFPAHLPDPEKPENLRQLQELVVREKLDAGIALDGDCDRIGLVSKSGAIFRPEKLVYALLQYYAKPGDVVVLDATMPLYLERLAEERGVRIIRQRVGHAFQKPTAARNNAIFWAEYSGHVGFRENNYFDDGLYAALKLFEALSRESKSLDDVLNEAPRVYEERIDFKSRDPKGDVERIKPIALTTTGVIEIVELDGVDIRFKDGGRALIRPSNTEPLIRIKLEAPNEEILDKLKNIINEFKSYFTI